MRPRVYLWTHLQRGRSETRYTFPEMFEEDSFLEWVYLSKKGTRHKSVWKHCHAGIFRIKLSYSINSLNLGFITHKESPFSQKKQIKHIWCFISWWLFNPQPHCQTAGTEGTSSSKSPSTQFHRTVRCNHLIVHLGNAEKAHVPAGGFHPNAQ